MASTADFGQTLNAITHWMLPESWSLLWLAGRNAFIHRRQAEELYGDRHAHRSEYRSIGEPDADQWEAVPGSSPLEQAKAASLDSERRLDEAIQSLDAVRDWLTVHANDLLGMLPNWTRGSVLRGYDAPLAEPEARRLAGQMSKLHVELSKRFPQNSDPVTRYCDAMEQIVTNYWDVAGKFITYDSETLGHDGGCALDGWDAAYQAAGLIPSIETGTLQRDVRQAAKRAGHFADVDREMIDIDSDFNAYVTATASGHKAAAGPLTQLSLRLREFRRWEGLLGASLRQKNTDKRRKRGGQRKFDPKDDAIIDKKWQSHQYETYAELGRSLDPQRGEEDVRKALDRHRHRKRTR